MGKFISRPYFHATKKLFRELLDLIYCHQSRPTAAVAHKMNRRYIGIEQGEHAVTHCAQRLKLVVAAEPDGISKLVGWQGGGGVDFYRFVQGQGTS